jgi:hypothetical protein
MTELYSRRVKKTSGNWQRSGAPTTERIDVMLGAAERAGKVAVSQA